MKTRSFSLAKLVVVSTILSAAAGCASESPNPDLALPTDGAEVENVLVSSVITLTPIDSVSTPVIHRFAENRHVIDAAKVETLDTLRGKLRSGDTIAIDLATVDQAHMNDYRDFVESARASGVAIVLENVHTEEMARLIGVGVDGKAVLVRPLPGVDRSEVKIYSGPEDTVKLVPSPAEVTTSINTEMLDAYLAMNDEERAALAAEQGTDVAALDELAAQAQAGYMPPALDEKEPEEIVARPELLTVDEIVSDIAQNLPKLGTTLATPVGTPKAGSYKYNYFNYATYTYTATDASKTSSIDIDVEQQLVAANKGFPQGKFLIYSAGGAGVTSGGMTWDTKGGSVANGRRGWYQEMLRFTFTPTSGTAALANYNHAPLGDNTSGTFDTSVGCSIGGDSTGANFSCSASSSTSQTLTDFGVIDTSNGLTTQWSFKMMKCGGGAYNDWTSLQDNTWGGVHGVPNLAKSTMAPRFQAIYRAAITYTGTSAIKWDRFHQLRDVRHDGKLFVQQFYMRGYQATGNATISVNFGSVVP